MMTYEEWLAANDVQDDESSREQYHDYVARFEMEARLRLQEVGLVPAF